jgi:hypothetical protein
MNGLSISQPWAWAILNLGKDIENRPWKTTYRGWIAIHAPIKIMPYEKSDFPRGSKIPKKEDLVTSAIVGVARISDCVEKNKSKWHQDGYYGFVLTSVHKLKKPIECKGARKFWKVPAPLLRKIKVQLPKLNLD